MAKSQWLLVSIPTTALGLIIGFLIGTETSDYRDLTQLGDAIQGAVIGGVVGFVLGLLGALGMMRASRTGDGGS